MWRVSTQTTGSPASSKSVTSHCDIGPASRPIRAYSIPASIKSATIASGSVVTLASRTIFPVSSTMQIAVSLTETSNPAQCFMAVLSSVNVLRPAHPDLVSNVSVKDCHHHLQQSPPEPPRYPISAKAIANGRDIMQWGGLVHWVGG